MEAAKNIHFTETVLSHMGAVHAATVVWYQEGGRRLSVSGLIAIRWAINDYQISPELPSQANSTPKIVTHNGIMCMCNF